jgi:monovalent cation/hydrogen antiporter
MTLFETTLLLLVVALVLLRASRTIGVPYPTLLALAGTAVALLPFRPEIALDPHLALALFIAPALLDAAYDLPPRELVREWLPLTVLVLFATVLTTLAVAWAAHELARLPWPAAITLGAIVAPPDAVAASTVLRRFALPPRLMAILQGESLLNDAVALLIFSAGVSLVSSGRPSTSLVPELLVAVPGGILVGWLIARLNLLLRPHVAGRLSATILEFATTFGAWLVAERLHLSPILAVVAFAMVVARHAPRMQSARDRVQSYAVWDAAVFVLNVLAFMLMGLSARAVLARFDPASLGRALEFAGLVLALVIGVRLTWVFASGLTGRILLRSRGGNAGGRLPSPREGVLIGWCGMRGLVSLATAFALPAGFPGRDLIVLSAFTVVLGTLVLQGCTLRPLLALLKLEPDESRARELSYARKAMFDAAIASAADQPGADAAAVRTEYEAARSSARDEKDPQAPTEHDRLRLAAIVAQRAVLARVRDEDRISDEVFNRLQEELDWAELSAAHPEDARILDA